jgi:hypothetical protein
VNTPLNVYTPYSLIHIILMFSMWSGNHKFYIQFLRLLRLQTFIITLYLGPCLLHVCIDLILISLNLSFHLDINFFAEKLSYCSRVFFHSKINLIGPNLKNAAILLVKNFRVGLSNIYSTC